MIPYTRLLARLWATSVWCVASGPRESIEVAAGNSVSAGDTCSTSAPGPPEGAAASPNWYCSPSPEGAFQFISNNRSRKAAAIETDVIIRFYISYLCDASDESVEAGRGAHLLRRNHEAALLLVVAQQHIQVTLHSVESFGAADVRLGAALVFGHEFHEHHDQLVNRLVVYAGVLRQQVSDHGVVLRRRGLAYKRGWSVRVKMREETCCREGRGPGEGGVHEQRRKQDRVGKGGS